jgi:hypothetical protein
VIFQKKLTKVLKHYNFLSATTTQLLSSSEFCKLRYDTILVKSASANISFYKSNYKVYVYIVSHNYVLGGMLLTICKAQLQPEDGQNLWPKHVGVLYI